MDKETADLLVETITEALRLAAESQLRIISLERTLERENPNLCESWRMEIESLKKQKAYEMNRALLDSLGEKLLQA